MAISAKKFRNDLKKNGVFYTDKALAEEIRALLPTEVPEVYDPTCGDGALLSVFPDDTKKYGQDILSEQVEDAEKRIKNFTGVVGDTLLNPAFANKKFQYIVANPPFSIKWEPEKLKNDPRFSCAPVLPPQSKADYAFILHILYYLEDSGMAAVLNFPGILYRGQREGKIREWIVRNNWVEKIIHIPGGHFEDTNIATALVVFKKLRATTDVEFVDTENNISRLVPFDEIEKNDFNLSVSAYVQPKMGKEDVEPERVQAEARKLFIERLKNELDIDYTVCRLESKDCKKTVFSFVRFLGQIQEVINHYLERLEALKDGDLE